MPSADATASPALAEPATDLAAALNHGCHCISLDEAALEQALAAALGDAGLAAQVRTHCPHAFAARPVFVSEAHAARMVAMVAAVESVVALPAWRHQVLAQAPAIARHAPGDARGVLFGYDFHVDGDRIGLIEINTNAGGAMLCAVLARAQRGCCAEIERMLPADDGLPAFEAALVAMFREEWARAGHSSPLTRIAIVDTAPAQQYLYPEFLLFQRLFRQHGIEALILDPGELQLRAGRLEHDGQAIDLVYNRLTDFMLEQPAHALLRQAHLDGAALLTPHPQAHALYADKRNLALLSDDAALQALGVPAATRALLLAQVPRTEQVDAANAERLWRTRRQLFFKPAAGFGSRAAYRGDKLTQRVWQDILAGNYMAQALVPPGQRALAAAPEPALKYDLRLYVYAGQVLATTARLYQGQTTNFRTPGGGFAPVYVLPGGIALDPDCD